MENERSWDGHQQHRQEPRRLRRARPISPIAGLLTDLDSRGLLDSTLVLCCGEFGRLPIVQKGAERAAITIRTPSPPGWPAAASRAASRYGETDEIGFKAVVNKVSVNDLHATVLHLLGIEHTQLTYRYSGRDFRLTDVEGTVVRDVIA